MADWRETARAQSACAVGADCLSTDRRHVLTLPCRNGELVNPFKVDLHALYVAEALARLEETIVSLRRMKCELPCQHHVLPDTLPIHMPPLLSPVGLGQLLASSLQAHGSWKSSQAEAGTVRAINPGCSQPFWIGCQITKLRERSARPTQGLCWQTFHLLENELYLGRAVCIVD